VEVHMDRKAFLMMLGEFQNIRLDMDKVGRIVEPGQMFDQLQFIKSVLFDLDVSGFKPKDDLDFFQGDKK
jgi:hypothetical protein